MPLLWPPLRYSQSLNLPLTTCLNLRHEGITLIGKMFPCEGKIFLLKILHVPAQLNSLWTIKHTVIITSIVIKVILLEAPIWISFEFKTDKNLLLYPLSSPAQRQGDEKESPSPWILKNVRISWWKSCIWNVKGRSSLLETQWMHNLKWDSPRHEIVLRFQSHS